MTKDDTDSSDFASEWTVELDEVAEPWASDLPIKTPTTTDLDASRTKNTAASDPDKELHQLIETLRRREGLDSKSETVDRAFRVELAHAIDRNAVSFTREQYDVAYLIPPEGWLEQRTFSEEELIPKENTNSDRRVDFSTPPVCYEMASDAVEEDAFNTLSEISKKGAKRMLGRLSEEPADHRSIAKGSENPDIFFTIRLFKNKSRRQLVKFALNEMGEKVWYRTGEIVEAVGVGRESIRVNMKKLILLGVFDTRDAKKNVTRRPLKEADGVNQPHYRRSDSDVIKFLDTWDGYSLIELFSTKATHRLIRFFLTEADDNRSYSRNQIQKESQAGYKGVRDYIHTLVDAGLVNEVEGKRGTEYKLNVDSDVIRCIYELNELLYRTFEKRRE